MVSVVVLIGGWVFSKRYCLTATEYLSEHLKSSGMGGGLPVSLVIAWLSYLWMPKILTLILGAISIVGAEAVHYVFPNLVNKGESFNKKA